MGELARERRRLSVTAVLSCAVLMLGLAVSGGAASAASHGLNSHGITVPPTVTASSWQVNYQGPPTTSFAESDAVSCVSSTFCIGAGFSGEDTQIEQWNGTTWATVASPSYSGNQFTSMSAVSCVNVSFCAAVGDTEVAGSDVPYTPAAMMWNGLAWTLVALPTASPTQGDTVLNGVSCLSATWCIAVGSSRPTLDVPTVPWAVSWNGTAWSSMTLPTTGDGELNGIACDTATFCAAVGDSYNTTNELALEEAFNGTQWTVAATSTAPPGPNSQLNSVSCAGTAFCAAVGYQEPNGDNFYGATTLAEMWNGSAWSYVPSPNQDTTGNNHNLLDSVSCFSATGCAAVGAVGQNGDENSYLDMAEYWNGASWQLAPVPHYPYSTPSETANGVSCVSDWACIAVGHAVNATTGFDYHLMAPIARSGYRFVASDGGVFNYGTGAPFLGSLGGTHLNAPIVGVGVMPAGDGYYLAASDGGVFAYGSAQFYGSMGGTHLNKPVVGIAVTPDGAGYWLVASDGGVFAFGDATFYGSAGSLTLNKPVVGIASTPNGLGYWIVASDGGVFNYGPAAAFLGSTGGMTLSKPVVGMGATTSGQYYLVASDGGIFAFPEGPSGPIFYGSTSGTKLNKPIVGMTVLQGGYYLSGSDGGIFAYPTGPGGLPFFGSTGGMTLNAPIVGVAS
jgi:hypothetical protein